MNPVPLSIQLLFILTTLVIIWLFYRASQRNKTTLVVIILWGVVVGILGISGFYQNFDVIPPRFIFLPIPAFILIIILFFTRSGRSFIDSLDSRWLTLLHTIRIPAEICLLYIYLSGLIPVTMTFEGFNFDFFSGITAPIIYFLAYRSRQLGSKGLIAWNIVCLLLLINIVTIAILSAKTPFQVLSLDQPNIGITIFPFVWLPAIVVPLVFLAHVAVIRQLVLEKSVSN